MPPYRTIPSNEEPFAKVLALCLLPKALALRDRLKPILKSLFSSGLPLSLTRFGFF